jgi:hypothetical protein
VAVDRIHARKIWGGDDIAFDKEKQEACPADTRQHLSWQC